MSIIEAKKDKIFNKMKYLSKKYWKLDTFEREQDNKFVEDETQLEIVGQELWSNFGLDKKNIKLFADFGAAPGIYSKIVLNTINNSNGIGVSLPVEEGGVPFKISDHRYQIIYKNVLDPTFKLDLTEPLDLGLGSLVSYQHDARNSFYLNIQLILTGLMLILSNLKKGGHIVTNLTIKNVELGFNIVNILSSMFTTFKIWKSSNVWATKNTFYFFGYSFKENYSPEILLNILKQIKNENDPINNYFIGTSDEYNKIYTQMKTVYIIRIKAWEKLIEINREKLIEINREKLIEINREKLIEINREKLIEINREKLIEKLERNI